MNFDLIIQSGDSGKTFLIDSSNEPINVQLPAPSSGFLVTIKDSGGNAELNAISVYPNGSELIDGLEGAAVIDRNGAAVTFVSDGTNWSRFDGYVPDGIRLSGIGVWGGGFTAATQLDSIESLVLSTGGATTSFGTLSLARGTISGTSSRTRALFAGGSAHAGTPYNVIDYNEFSVGSTSLDFGDLTSARRALSGFSNQTRSVNTSGSNISDVAVQAVDVSVISSKSNASNVGSLSVARYRTGGCGNSTRGINAGGINGSGNSNVIDYVNYASLGNAASFGTLAANRRELGGASNHLRGLFAGGLLDGDVLASTVEFVTIATLGNAASFGNLTIGKRSCNGIGVASATHALFGGGSNLGASILYTDIDQFTVAQASNATIFGQLTQGRISVGTSSSSHGGLYV